MLAMCLVNSHATVIGVDLGSQFFKGTLVKPGYPFTIVENTASQRKTPTAVAFTDEQRVYGLDAVMQSSSNPARTFTYVRDLLGLEYNEHNVAALKAQFFNFNNLVADERGYVAFKVDMQVAGSPQSFVFTVEEILAMILAQARAFAETQSKGSVKDLYLTVPSSFTMNQRRMLNDAAEFAGLKCIGMIEENVASAIAYGVDRKDDNQTHTAMFLNLGSSDFEVTVINFYARSDNKTDKYGNTKIGDVVENIEVLSQATTDRVSGRLFDIELLNILAERFNAMKSRVGKPDIRESPRIVNRLFKEVAKIKDTLSANKEMLINLPEVADYENLKLTLQRTEFEDSIDKYMQYLVDTIHSALDQAQLKVQDLAAVELIGGALRVPKVKDVLAGVVGEQLLGTHLNGDESMSFGAAFLGANSSSSFVVRKLYLHRYVGEPIYVNITSANLTSDDPNYVKKRFVLYDGGDSIKRKYAIHTLDDLKVDYYTQSKGVIHSVMLSGIADVLASQEYQNNGTTPRVVFETSYTPGGFIEVNGVSAKVTQTYMHKQERTVRVPSATDEAGTRNATEAAADANSTDTTADDSTQTSNDNTDAGMSDDIIEQPDDGVLSNTTNANLTESANATDDKPKYETVIEFVPKNRTHTMAMRFNEVFVGHTPLNTDQKISALAHIVDLEKHDKLIHDTLKAKNDFEALIYATRDWLDNQDHRVYSTPEVLEDLQSRLADGETWLYEEGYDEKLEVYRARIDGINSTVSQMKYRHKEHALREELFPGTKTFLANITNEIDAFAKQFPWIEDSLIGRVRELAKNATEWFEDTLAEQQKLALHEDPVLTSGAVRDKVFSIGYVMQRLSKTPKPKNWDAKRADKSKPGAADSADAANTANATATSENTAATNSTQDARNSTLDEPQDSKDQSQDSEDQPQSSEDSRPEAKEDL